MIAPINILSHRDDPSTSRDAIAALTANGGRSQHMAIVLDAVKSHPGLTACELISVSGLDEYQVRRRLCDLKNAGRLVHGDRRICSVKGSSMVTWRIATE